MEKQRVNDAVVRLGNLIGMGRTRIVHKLSAKIRDLRKKNEAKFEQRIQRLLREIAFLKTMTNSRSRKLVSRRILLSEENHAAKIEAEATKPEDRAFHRLCKEKCISDYVSKFREDNIDWKYWMPPLLEMWQKKLELKQQRSKKPDSEKDKKNRPSIKEIVGKKTREDNEDSGSDQDDEESDSHEEEAQKPGKNANKDSKSTQKAASNPAKRAKLPQKLGTDSADSSGEDDEGSEEEDEDEPSQSDDADEEVVFNWKSKPKDYRAEGSASSEEEDASVDDEEPSEGCDEESDGEAESGEDQASVDGEGSAQPFRPYAPNRTGSSDSEEEDGSEEEGSGDGEGSKGKPGSGREVGDFGDESEESGSEEEMDESEEDDDDGEEEDEDGEEEDEDGEEEDEEEEASEDGSEEDSEDSEDEAEVARKRKLLLGGSDRSKSKELQIDFSVQKKLDRPTNDLDDPAIREKADEKKKQMKLLKSKNIQAGKGEPVKPGGESDAEESSSGSEEESDDGASFFVKQGETAKEIPSRTIPKEKAPGLNRRERRGNLEENRFPKNSEEDYEEDGAAFHDRNGSRGRGGFQNGRTPRGRGSSFNGQGRPSFQERFGDDRRGGHRGRGGFGPSRGGFRGGRNSFTGGHDRKPYERSDPRGRFGRDSANRGGRGDHSNGGDRRSFGGFDRNPREDHSSDRKSFGGRGGGGGRGRGFMGGQRGGRGGSWTPRGPTAHGDDRFNGPSSHGEPRKSFGNAGGTPRDGKQFGNRPPAGMGAADGGGDRLHPSWAAKKKASASINQPFQGKKIVFSED